MARFVVTTSNYADPAFWFSISVSSTGNTLDFSALPSGFVITVDPAASTISIWDGSVLRTITEPGMGGFANFGVPTNLDFFDEIVIGNAQADLRGSDGPDTLTTGAAADQVQGGIGNDTISTGGGDDVVTAGSGNDSVNAGDGADYVIGGIGDDSVSGGTGADTLLGDEGRDSLFGGTGNDSISGGLGNDSMDGGDGADVIRGDVFTGSFASYASTGGTSTPVTFVNNSDQTVQVFFIDQNGIPQPFGTLAPGQSIAYGSNTGHNWALRDTATNEWVAIYEGALNQTHTYAGPGDDTIVGGQGTDSLFGNGGNDFIDGGSENDSIFGGSGNDSIAGGLGADSLDGGTGNDSLSGGAGNDTLLGGDGADTLFHTRGEGNDSIVGGEGGTDLDTLQLTDAAFGGSGAVITYSSAEAGNLAFNLGNGTFSQVEVVRGTESGDIFLGGAATTGIQAYGEGGSDSMQGGSGNDTLFGGTGGDSILGGAGNDTVFGGADADTVSGGTGNDNLSGDDGNDTLFGDAGTDQLFGGAGADSLSGGDAADTIQGGDGNDTLVGGIGADSLIGGAGTDTADYATSTSAVTVNLTTGVNSRGDAAGDTLSGIENITGSNFDDILTGDAGNNVLVGGAGNDTLTGGAGTDTADYAASGAGVTVNLGTGAGSGGHATGDMLSGIENVTGSGFADNLTGDAAANALAGGAGNDTLSGGMGNDNLTGGSGNDVLDFTRFGGADVITDFSLTDSDGDGRFDDQLDVSELRTLSGNPVRAWDVTVTDDGNGNALLIFPEGETVLLMGVSPAQMQSPGQKFAAGIPCFTTGTMIRTPRGELPIEALRPGDLVLTRDNGAQPLVWVGSRHLDATDLALRPDLRPVVFEPGALAQDRRLLVSPQHGMLIGHGAGEALVRATHLARLPGAGKVRIAHGIRSVTYVHLMFENHQVIWGNGLPSESFYPGLWGLSALDLPALLEVSRLFPDAVRLGAAAGYGATARPFLRYAELQRHAAQLWSEPPRVHLRQIDGGQAAMGPASRARKRAATAFMGGMFPTLHRQQAVAPRSLAAKAKASA